MLCNRWFLGIMAGVSLLLVTGCRSAPKQGRDANGQTPGPVMARGKGQGKDWPADKLAEAHAHYAAAIVYEMEENTQAALEEYYQAALNDPDNEALILEVSRRLLQQKQPEKALAVVSAAAARPRATGAIFARLGMIDAQLGKNEQAAAANRAAIKRSPDSLAGYQNLVLLALQKKQSPEALKVLEAAGRQPKADADFLVGLAELCASVALQSPSEKEKLDAQALAALKRADKLNPAGMQLRLRLADSFAALGETGRAAALYLDLVKKLPDVPFIRERVHAKLASIYLRGSDNKKAIEQFEAVIRDDPTNPQAYFYLGRLYYEAKDSAHAADCFSKTIVLNPGAEEAYCYLALSQIGINQSQEALATLDKARQKFPQDFDVELITALAYTRQKAYPQAIRHYTAAEVIAKATEPARLNQEFYFEIGAAYERTGDYTQAEDYFQKCLQLAPDFSEALNYLGYMWAEHGVKLDRARGLIQKALQKEPQNPAYLDSLGWVLFKLKQPQDALGYILKAVQLSKDPDPTVLDHLGDIYAALDQPQKAREAWTKSLTLEANEQVRRKLEAVPPAPGQAPNPKSPEQHE